MHSPNVTSWTHTLQYIYNAKTLVIQNVTVHFTNMARQTWPWWALFCRIFLCFWEEILWCGLETHYSRRLRCMVSGDIPFGYLHVQTLQYDIKWPFMVTLVTWASLALAKFRFHRNTKKIVGSKIIGSMGDDRFSTVKAQFTLISCKVAGERWSRDFVDQKPSLVLGLVGPG